jgi:sec-independent protein translocase protein TatC
LLKSARKKEKNPEGRMPLVEHLRELRNRLAKASLAIVLGAIGAAFFSQELMAFLASPVPRCTQGLGEKTGGDCAVVAYLDLVSPFTTTVKVSLMAGIIATSPIWLYQLWAFVAPGLHKHERKYTYAFVAAAVPLFLGGAWMAYLIMPVSMRVLLEITPDGSSNILPMDKILDFTVRMVLVSGISFELPLMLTMLNLAGAVSARRMFGWWRGVVMGVVIFGALATPSTDPLGMFALAGPMIFLYFVAVGFAFFNDRRKRRRDPDVDLSDDEASRLDLTPEAVDRPDAVANPRRVPGQTSDERHRINGYDDVT